MVTTSQIESMTMQDFNKLNLGEKVAIATVLEFGFQSKVARHFLKSGAYINMIAKGHRTNKEIEEKLNQEAIEVFNKYMKNNYNVLEDAA